MNQEKKKKKKKNTLSIFVDSEQAIQNGLHILAGHCKWNIWHRS